MLSLELGRRLRNWPLWAVSSAIGLVLIGVAQVAVPALPASGKRFVLRAFELVGVGDFVLLNDLLTLYAVPFFAGMVALQDVLLRPREEGLLDVLLSKPITRRAYWYGATASVLVLAAAQGILLALACSAAVLWEDTATVKPALAFVSALVTLAVALLALVATNAAWLWVQDSLTAIVVGFVVWIGPLLGTTVFLYRPDVMAGARAALLAFPLNTVWMAQEPGVAPVALTAIAAATAGVLVASARRFEQTELR